MEHSFKRTEETELETVFLVSPFGPKLKNVFFVLPIKTDFQVIWIMCRPVQWLPVATNQLTNSQLTQTATDKMAASDHWQ